MHLLSRAQLAWEGESWLGEAAWASVRGTDWTGQAGGGGQWSRAEQAPALRTVTGPSLGEGWDVLTAQACPVSQPCRTLARTGSEMVGGSEAPGPSFHHSGTHTTRRQGSSGLGPTPAWTQEQPVRTPCTRGKVCSVPRSSGALLPRPW